MVPWQVIFRDIDTFGHVNNAVYLTYFEHARTSMWLALTVLLGSVFIAGQAVEYRGLLERGGCIDAR